MEPIAVARRVLELSEAGDSEGILNIAQRDSEVQISRASDAATMRKAYLRLSLLIHPDKLSRAFPDATKAFQALVRAFEELSAPSVESLGEAQEETGAGKKGKGKAAPLKLSRSNENCHRTRVLCPRCRQPWNEGTLDGNPDYFYNFLMTGLKQYMCSTCLCEFGCVSAIHQCPFCKHNFEYHPSSYHQQIVCRNAKCAKAFGFYLFHVSDRALKDMKTQVKNELEAKQKQREAKQRRAMRSSARGELSMKEKEASFMCGLADICPRCGEDFTEFADEDIVRDHLLNCHDEEKIIRYATKQKLDHRKKEAIQEIRLKQDSLQTAAAWEFLGANASQLWLLDEDQLKVRATQLGLNSDGNKDDLIEVLAQKDGDGEVVAVTSKPKRGRPKKSDELVIVPPSSSRTVVTTNKKQKKDRIDISTLPGNMHSLSVSQLRSLCIANGLKEFIPPGATKSDLLDILEDNIFE